jgi:hypothetical protein
MRHQVSDPEPDLGGGGPRVQAERLVEGDLALTAGGTVVIGTGKGEEPVAGGEAAGLLFAVAGSTAAGAGEGVVAGSPGAFGDQAALQGALELTANALDGLLDLVEGGVGEVEVGEFAEHLLAGLLHGLVNEGFERRIGLHGGSSSRSESASDCR